MQILLSLQVFVFFARFERAISAKAPPPARTLEPWRLRPQRPPIVSVVVPFWGYLMGFLVYSWSNKKRNYKGDHR